MQTIQQNEAALSEFLTKGASFGGESDQSERSLMEMAYAVLVDRARPLMRDPFRLGFEVVYSNEDSTKMVGIFVFRVGKNIFYIPVFYRNGRVRGLHTIYDCRRKKVKPLTVEWCERLVSMSVHRDGKQVDQSLKHQYGSGNSFRNPNNLYNTELGGGTIKVASVRPAKEVLGDEPFEWIEALKLDAADYEPGETLRKVASEIGVPAARDIRDAISRDDTFMYGMSALTGDVTEFFKALDFSKHATVADEKQPALEIIPTRHPDFAKNAAAVLSEEELTEASIRGWAVVDRRELDKRASILAKLPDGEIISEPGCYDVVFEDGKTRKCTALIDLGYDTPLRAVSPYRDDCPEPVSSKTLQAQEPMSTKFILITEDGGEISQPHLRVYATDKDVSEGSIKGSDTMECSQYYAVVNKNSGSIEGFFTCYEKKQEGKRTSYTGSFDQTASSQVYFSTVWQTLIHNPEAKESRPGEGRLGAEYTFIRIGSDVKKEEERKDCDPAEYPSRIVRRLKTSPVDALSHRTVMLSTSEEPDAGIYSVGKEPHSKAVTVTFDSIMPTNYDAGPLKKNASESVNVPVRKKIGRFETQDGAAAAIMLHSGLSWEESRDLASGDNSVMVKRASLTEQPGLPAWTTGYDGTHNVAIEHLQKYVIPVDSPEYQPEDILASRLGDREGLQDTPNLLIATPSDLFEFSRANDVKSLFEHTAVTQLVKTYNVGNMIDSYLPELEQALDRLGRILILLHWKPAEVSEIYGVEDTVTLEDKLLSGFLNLGEIYLELDTKIRGAASEDD